MAFADCDKLERIIIPSTVKEIHKQAFEHCNRLVAIELLEGLERIGKRVFYGCTSLESIIIPVTVNYIAVNAFKDCDSLAAVDFCDKIEQFGIMEYRRHL